MSIDKLIEDLRAEGIEATVVEPEPSRMGRSRLLPLSHIRGCLHITKQRYSWKQLRNARWRIYERVKGDLRFRFKQRRSLGP